MLAVGGFSVAGGTFQQLFLGDPAVLVGDLLGGGNLDALALLDGLHKGSRLDEGVHRAGVEPGVAAAQQLDVQLALVEIHLVQRRDLQLPAGAGLDLLGHFDNVAVVEVQARDRVVALGVSGLFLNVGGVAVLVKRNDAETLGVVDVVAKDGAAAIGSVGGGIFQTLGEARAVEDVVAQDHGAAVVANELLAQDKRLGQAVGAGLDLVLQMQAVLAAVTQQRLKARGVGRGGDDQNVLNARQHQGRQRIVDHRLVIDGQQLFGCDHRQRVKSGAGAAGQDNTFHRLQLLFYSRCRARRPSHWGIISHNTIKGIIPHFGAARKRGNISSPLGRSLFACPNCCRFVTISLQ